MDSIDKRDRQEKMARSIVKRRNVVYTYPQEIGKKTQEADQKEDDSPQEILEYLAQEHRADEEKWQREIEHLLQEQEKSQEEIRHILNEKQEYLKKAMSEAAQMQNDGSGNA